MQNITKQFDASFTLDKDSREFISVISTDAIDRVGDVMIPKGLRKKNYSGNPVVLFNHDTNIPIGVCRWIKPEGNKLIAKTYITDKTQFGRDVFGLLQDGIIGAMSISFTPLNVGLPTSKELKERPELVNATKIIREWELLEYSIVTIPCNPECLALAVAKGYSPNILKFFNGGVMPSGQDLIAKDYCQWDDAPEPEAKALPVAVAPVAEAKPVNKWAGMPMPKYSRSVDLVLADRLEQLSKRLNEKDVLDRYLGRV